MVTKERNDFTVEADYASIDKRDSLFVKPYYPLGESTTETEAQQQPRRTEKVILNRPRRATRLQE